MSNHSLTGWKCDIIFWNKKQIIKIQSAQLTLQLNLVQPAMDFSPVTLLEEFEVKNSCYTFLQLPQKNSGKATALPKPRVAHNGTGGKPAGLQQPTRAIHRVAAWLCASVACPNGPYLACFRGKEKGCSSFSYRESDFWGTKNAAVFLHPFLEIWHSCLLKRRSWSKLAEWQWSMFIPKLCRYSNLSMILKWKQKLFIWKSVETFISGLERPSFQSSFQIRHDWRPHPRVDGENSPFINTRLSAKRFDIQAAMYFS